MTDLQKVKNRAVKVFNSIGVEYIADEIEYNFFCRQG